MSFNVPKNTPSFNNPQRVIEDHIWGSTAVARGPNSRHGPGGGIFSGVQDRLFEDRNALPMYKDKPYAYPPSHRRRAFYTKKRYWLLASLVIWAIFWFSGYFDDHKEKVKEHIGKNLTWLKEQDGRAKSNADWLKRRERVVEAFELSWDSYEKHAWGEYTPLSFVYHRRFWLTHDCPRLR